MSGDNEKVIFPSNLLRDVMNYWRKNKVSVIVNDNLKLSYDFGGHNQHHRFLRKNISVDKAKNIMVHFL